MRKINHLFILLLAIMLGFSTAYAANFKDLPRTIQQPDGTSVSCFVSGDEFYNYLHDADGYTIIQGQDGWYYYATSDNKGNVIPSAYKAGQTNPAGTGLQKNVKISKEKYLEKVEAFMAPLKDPSKGGELISKAPATGSFNNPVVYIRFADDSEFSVTRQTYMDLFTGTDQNPYSVQEYYQEVSYGQLTVYADHYPACAASTNISYQDSHNRNYFQPYNATTNPAGYADENEREAREHQLLVDALTYVQDEIENDYTAAQLDMDGDGRVDNISFIVYGNADEWAELLWAHRWALYSQSFYLNGKRVWDYNFQPEEQCSARTTCHELFHCMGAPDLYHYYDYTDVDAAYTWDLMESGNGSMTAYMKEAVAGWISIPEITADGSYTLNPLASSTNNAFMIPFPNSSTEYLVVEYRKKTGPVEEELHSWTDEGLLIYRINTTISIDEGNRNGPPDMLWVYRPNGDTYTNGNPEDATFSSTNGRTTFNASSNPECHLSDDATWGQVAITNVGAVGTTISFDVSLQGYSVTFNVSDGSSPIEGASVTYRGINKTTNASGQAVFTGVQDGSSGYLITKTGYDDASGTINMSGSNVVENVTMNLTGVSTYDVTFNVSDGTDPINDAWVTFDGELQYTNTSGQTIFNGKTDGVYSYSIAKSGFITSTGSVTVSGSNVIKNVTMGIKTYHVRFVVDDGTNPLSGVTVSLDGQTKTTGSTGITYVKFLAPGTYSYSLTKTGYSTVEGSVTISGYSPSKYITMTANTGTQLNAASCGSNHSNLSDWIAADKVIGAELYEFEMTNIEGGAPMYRQVAFYGTRLINFAGITYNATYDVRVRVRIGGEWQSYGTTCQVSTNLSKSQDADDLFVFDENWSATVFPNPSSSEFTVKINGDYEQPLEVYLMDITGKVIYRQNAYDIGEIRLGGNLEQGVYLLVIQGNRLKESFRLIKTE